MWPIPAGTVIRPPGKATGRKVGLGSAAGCPAVMRARMAASSWVLTNADGAIPAAVMTARISMMMPA